MIGLSLATASVDAAEPADLKSFASEESYIVDGVRVALKRIPGEVTLRLGPGLQPANVFTAFNGATFDKNRERSAHLTIYKMRSDDPVTEAASKEAIDSLNEDPNVRYAYPVYANPVSGAPVFLNDELVVCLKEQLNPGQLHLLAAFDAELVETLSAGQGMYVLRFRQPKNFNPFSVCRALCQRDEVI